MSIKWIDSALCRGCGRCDRICPMDVIYFDRQNRLPAVRYPEDCQTCFLCVLACPAGCIQVTPRRNKENAI